MRGRWAGNTNRAEPQTQSLARGIRLQPGVQIILPDVLSGSWPVSPVRRDTAGSDPREKPGDSKQAGI